MPHFLIKEVFGLFLNFSRNAVNDSFTLDGRGKQMKKPNFSMRTPFMAIS